MKQWRGYEKLKKICLTYIASQLNENEINNLRKIFQKLDIKGDGVLHLKEFNQALSEAKIDHKDIEDVFNSIDIDKSG